MVTAKQLISRNVVTAFPDQRLAYLAPEIEATTAECCVVLEPGSHQLLSIVRFSDLAGRAHATTRIFADLVRRERFYEVPEAAPLSAVKDIFRRSKCHSIVVLGEQGVYVGLITLASLAQHLLAETGNSSLEDFPKPGDGRLA
jgi:CBS domain containing-hemolysin-like protein